MSFPYNCWRSFCNNCQTEWTCQQTGTPSTPTCLCGLQSGTPNKDGTSLMLRPWSVVGRKPGFQGKWRRNLRSRRRRFERKPFAENGETDATILLCPR